MAKELAFLEAYPLNARAAVHTPLVFRAGMASLADLPWPSLEGIRDFAHFAGISDGAVRTALSRAKVETSLLYELDTGGCKRFRLDPSTFEMGVAQIHSDQRPEGFLLAVFSFRSEENEERSSLRTLLKGYGFRKLAQNTYIHGRIGTESLRVAVRKLGLERHFFLFTCPEIDDSGLVARILELFDVQGRSDELRVYLAHLKAFLPESVSGDELARRLLYVGAVHWERIEASEPPFPHRYLPADYALSKIQRFYARRDEEGRDALYSYYERVNK